MGFFSDVLNQAETTEEDEYQLPPVGTYEFKVDEVIKRTRATNNPFSSDNEGVELRLLVNVGAKDYRARGYLVKSQNKFAIKKLFEVCDCLGLDPDSADPEDFVNKTGRATFEHREYNDRTYFSPEVFLPRTVKEDDPFK